MKKRLRHLFAFLLACALTGGFSTVSVANEGNAPATAPAHDVYEALYAAIIAGADEAQMMDNQLATIKHTLATQDPYLAAIEDERPGFLDAVISAMRPWVLEHSRRIQEQFKPDFITLLEEGLTVNEAQRMADFYASPVGVKLLRGVTQNFTGSNTLGDLAKFEEDVDVQSVGRDVDFAGRRGALSLSESDYLSEDGAVLRDAALMAKMEKLGPELVLLRTAMERAPIDAEIEEGMTANIEALVMEYLDSIEEE